MQRAASLQHATKPHAPKSAAVVCTSNPIRIARACLGASWTEDAKDDDADATGTGQGTSNNYSRVRVQYRDSR